MLHRRQYKEIARIIRESKGKKNLVDNLIQFFKEDNPLFDEEKFRKEINR